eukprot:SAG31_NODE_3265_length_4480_cov_19.931066_5_plen_45_part_00
MLLKQIFKLDSLPRTKFSRPNLKIVPRTKFRRAAHLAAKIKIIR